MVTAYLVFLGLLALERVFELRLSRRNIQWALARGGKEVGKRHYAPMVALHTGLFAGCIGEVVLLDRPFIPWLGASMLAVALAAQALRYAAISALGRHWNVRVVLIPGATLVDRGPYRFVRHPNYIAVALEGIAVPLMHTAYLTAITFTILNAAILAIRIRCEESALSACRDPGGVTARPRWLPLRVH